MPLFPRRKYKQIQKRIENVGEIFRFVEHSYQSVIQRSRLDEVETSAGGELPRPEIPRHRPCLWCTHRVVFIILLFSLKAVNTKVTASHSTH